MGEIGEIAGVAGAGIAGATGIGVVVRMLINMSSRISDHGARIAISEQVHKDTARVMERTVIIVSKLEERTKDL